MTSITLVLAALAVALLGSIFAVTLPSRAGRLASFVALLLASLLTTWCGIGALRSGNVAAGGNAAAHFLLRVDPTAGFFLAIIGVVAILCALYALGGKSADELRTGRTAGSASCLILLASVLACIANDVLLFIFAWELLAFSFFWAIAFAGVEKDGARSAYFTLTITHIAGAALAIGLLFLARTAGTFGVDPAVHAAAALPEFGRSAIFLLLLIGFGAKFGMLPMQAWMRYGYRAAPSGVAALMAGGALNVGFYGIARFVVPLGGAAISVWWPIVVLALGALGAVYGIAIAAGERDMRTLAAYSSVENAGIILVAFGVALCGRAVGDEVLYGLGIAVAYLQIVAHALAKCTLFLTASSLRDACGTTSFQRLGGLVKRMPVTTVAALAASLSLAALPPLAGFCSEWMVLEAMMQAFRTHDTGLETALAVCGALVGLAAGIAVVAFVKTIGVAFLGAARSESAARAIESHAFLRRGTLLLCAFAILAAGVVSRAVVTLFASSVQTFGGAGAVKAILAGPGLLQPGYAGFSSISPMGLFCSIVGFTLLFWIITHLVSRPAGRITETWTSGEPYRAWTQYTGTGFANPARVVLDALTRTVRSLDEDTYDSRSRPFFDFRWYAGLAGGFNRFADQVRKTQSGSIAAYLSYILGFAILLLLLLPSIRNW